MVMLGHIKQLLTLLTLTWSVIKDSMILISLHDKYKIYFTWLNISWTSWTKKHITIITIAFMDATLN